MKRSLWLALAVTVGGLLLIAAATDPGLPDNYWDNPAAGLEKPPHNWSQLEKNLQPQACARCHAEQFESWKQSLHAHAYSPGLVGQFPAMGHLEANACLKCHAPLTEQLYSSPESMSKSLFLSLKHLKNADKDVDGEYQDLPLSHSGVSCAVCHVRGLQRFGPPPKTTGAVGNIDAAAHGGFTATRAFENSGFCASCHQFPQSMAINGKPLENTLTEWKQSGFSKKGITCQQCHMPDRRHEFRGIHDPAMVAKGLDIKLAVKNRIAVLMMASKWIGHAFPTYVTPKVIVEADALDGAGKSVRHWQWDIVREIHYRNGWQEKRDTRLMPGEKRVFTASNMPGASRMVRFRVLVKPDHFYKTVYKNLLAGKLSVGAKVHILKAAKLAEANDYLLFEKTVKLGRPSGN